MAPKDIYVAVVGVGGVGGIFLSQLKYIQKKHPNVHLVAVSNSRRTLLSKPQQPPIDPLSYSTALTAAPSETCVEPALEPQALVDHLLSFKGPAILVDNTASPAVASTYPAFLSKGISVVTPNKKAFSGPQDEWDKLVASSRSETNPSGGLLYHEATVGAGLPILSTLNDLVAAGDQITRIEGVFSGTLSYLFNSFAPVDDSAAESSGSGGGGKWSSAVLRAKSLGYTEPDPRDDLNGQDVARKLVILARVAGLAVPKGTASFPVYNLVPEPLRDAAAVPVDEVLRRLPEFDEGMERVKEESERQGRVVRYIGKIDAAAGGGGLRVSLEGVDKAGPIGGLKGADNVVSFWTKRYGERPLVVQGAGAGGEVTAMGVTSDLLKVIQQIE